MSKWARTDNPERVASEMLLTGTREYWQEVCQHSIRSLQKKMALLQEKRQPIPTHFDLRLRQWREVLEQLS